MARIPGVPTLDPVNQPMMSPAEAGKPGQAIAGLGEVSNDAAETGLALDLYIKKAQEHVDSLAAQNELAKVYADTQNQLAKTQNSRDVAAVIENSNKTLNDVAAQWSKSPASVAIQMSADALRPDLTRIGTVRQVDLMGKELKITLNQQAEVLTGEYAKDRAAGGSGDMALGAFSTAVQGGVETGLLGDAEAGEYVRLFRQKGQEIQIRNGITNANPEVNQKTYDELQDRSKFPDVTQEQLDVFKGQALSAFEAHTKQQEWAEGQMAQNTMLRPLIDLHTNPATKQFDVEAARADVAQRYKNGKITVTQETVLENGLKAYQADVSGAVEKQAGQMGDDIIKMFHDHKYSDAYSELERQRPWLEQNGLSDKYKGLMNYGDQQRREERAEARANYTLSREAATTAKQQRDEISSNTFYAVLGDMADGKVYTPDQLQMLAGEGPGKMTTADVNKAKAAMKSYETNKDYAAASDALIRKFVVPPDASNEDRSRANAMYAQTYAAWQQRVNENPSESKQQVANEVLGPAVQEVIAQQVNKIFGAPPEPHMFSFRIGGGTFTSGVGFTRDKPPVRGAPKIDEQPTRPANVPDGYTYKTGSKGTGWYAPNAN